MPDSDSTRADGEITADERGRYPVCPSCRSAEVIAWPDADDDGRWKVEYECGSIRPDDDPEGCYASPACDVIDALRAELAESRRHTLSMFGKLAAAEAERDDLAKVLSECLAYERAFVKRHAGIPWPPDSGKPIPVWIRRRAEALVDA